VAALQVFGRADLANRIVQDYLDSYADGFNQYIRDLQRITIASRRTRILDRIRREKTP
jgi:acyl-homoserine lactone acylase PvdQ